VHVQGWCHRRRSDFPIDSAPVSVNSQMFMRRKDLTVLLLGRLPAVLDIHLRRRPPRFNDI
jgi:hypothetical protein